MNNFKLFSVFLAIMVFVLAGKSYSQDHKVEITPFGGYMLGGSVKFYQGKFKIQNAACYGGMIAVQLHGGNYAEFSYTGMGTTGDWTPYYGYGSDYPETTVSMAVNHFQIGSVNELPLDNEAVRPYGTLSLGTTWFNMKEENSTDEWLFSFGAGVGLKYFFNDKIGIRIQARMILPLVFAGGGFYIGTGGSGSYVSTTAPVVQGDFTGGLIIALGQY